MTPQGSSIPRIDSSTKVANDLRACFDTVLEMGAPAAFPYESLVSQGWSRVSGAQLTRLRRRQTVNRLGQGYGILSRKGYRSAFRYYRHIRIPLKTSGPDLDRHPDGSLRINSHVLTHAKWPSGLVVVAQTPPAELKKSGYTIGLWAFVASSDKFLECAAYATRFNGTGQHFVTPSGNPRGLDHSWTYQNKGESAFGRLSTANRDRYFAEFSCDRFPKQLLPQFDLPDQCHLYSAISSQHYY